MAALKQPPWDGGGPAPDDGWSGKTPEWRRQCERLSPTQREVIEAMACCTVPGPDFAEGGLRLGDLELERGAHGIVLFLYDSWFITYGQLLGLEPTPTAVPDPEELLLYDPDTTGPGDHRWQLMHGEKVELGEHSNLLSGHVLALGSYGTGRRVSVSDSSYAIVVPALSPDSIAEKYAEQWDDRYGGRKARLAQFDWKNSSELVVGKGDSARGVVTQQCHSLFGPYRWCRCFD